MHAAIMRRAYAAHVMAGPACGAHDARATIMCMHAGATLGDPMCGSGTFLIEAGLMATNTAPGLFRKHFPFQGWHDFDAQAYSKVCEQAKQAQRPWEGELLGNDIHPGALSLASRCGLLRTHCPAHVMSGAALLHACMSQDVMQQRDMQHTVADALAKSYCWASCFRLACMRTNL